MQECLYQMTFIPCVFKCKVYTATYVLRIYCEVVLQQVFDPELRSNGPRNLKVFNQNICYFVFIFRGPRN